MAHRMNIRIMKFPHPDVSEGRTFFEIDEQTLIEAVGLGTGNGKFRAYNKNYPKPDWSVEQPEEVVNNNTPATFDPMTTMESMLDVKRDEQGFLPIVALGHALVWAEDYTFAHVVMDLINNA